MKKNSLFNIIQKRLKKIFRGYFTYIVHNSQYCNFFIINMFYIYRHRNKLLYMHNSIIIHIYNLSNKIYLVNTLIAVINFLLMSIK